MMRFTRRTVCLHPPPPSYANQRPVPNRNWRTSMAKKSKRQATGRPIIENGGGGIGGGGFFGFLSYIFG